jgi:hypothetical protein
VRNRWDMAYLYIGDVFLVVSTWVCRVSFFTNLTGFIGI